MNSVLLKRGDVLTTKLTELTVEEVSIVDSPANGRPWSVIKNADGGAVAENADGSLVIDETAPAGPVRAAALAENVWKGISALETNLADPESEISKALDVNESARAEIWPGFSYISECMYAIECLLNSVDGTPFDGSLDHAIGSELCRIAYHFVDLSNSFGIDGMAAMAEMHQDMYPEESGTRVNVEMAKAGKGFGKRRMAKMGGALDSIGEAVGSLAELFEEMGGQREVIEMMEHGTGPRTKAVVLSDRLDTVEKAFDSGLAKLATLVSDSHTGLVTKIDGLRSSVNKAAPTSRQDMLPTYKVELAPVTKATGSDLPFGRD
jgi:hypothetical protein